MRRESSCRHPALTYKTIRNYLAYLLPVLAVWMGRYASLREVTREENLDAVAARPRPGDSAVLRLRTEETGNLAELVLGAATGRIRWALSHISVAVGGACLLLAAAGLSTALGYGVLTGSVSTQLPRLLGAAVARLPAAMVVAAVAVLLFGLLPWESTALAWTAVALVGVIGVFGPPLQWPTWMMDISPFTQIPKLPGGTVSWEPLIWLCAIALTISTGRPGRAAAPRPRRPGPFPPGRRDPRPDRRLREL